MHAKKDLILNPNADSMSKYSSKNKRACNEQDVCRTCQVVFLNGTLKNIISTKSKLYEQINSTEIALAHVQTQIACQKLQVPQAKAESNFNVFPAQNSSTAEFQWESQVPWFN